MADITLNGNVSTNNDITLVGNVSTSNDITLAGNIAAEVILGWVKWGNIKGTLSNQTDLQNELVQRDTNLNNHINNKNNPHEVTKSQVGLGQVDNTSDANKPISNATQLALNTKLNIADAYTKTQIDNKDIAVLNEAKEDATLKDNSVKAWANNKFLTEHQSLNEYRKASAQDVIDAGIVANIPTKNSELENDMQYITSSYHDSTKQDKLVNQVNIKSINNQPVIGSGNITIKSEPDMYLKAASVDYSGNKLTITNKDDSHVIFQPQAGRVDDVKVNGSTVVVNKVANVTVPTKTSDIQNDSGFIDASYHDTSKQDTLVNQSNIKSINNQSILGSGNINISGEPVTYIKDAVIDETGNELTLTKKDDTTVVFAPESGMVDDVKVDGTSVVTDKVANISLVGKQDVISTEKGIVKNNNTIGLTQAFYDYLDNVTYKKPTISTFNIQNASGSNVNGAYETGTTVTVAKINHNETNITSISGNLSFKQGSTVVESITPATSSTTITLASPINVTSNTTFYLTGTDTRAGALSANKSITFDRYAYIALSNSTTAPTSGTKKTTVSSFANSGTSVTYAAGQYLYLYTTTSGKTPATYVAGSWATVDSVESTVNNFVQANGTTYTYYAYRIGPFSASGTATYRV